MAAVIISTFTPWFWNFPFFFHPFFFGFQHLGINTFGPFGFHHMGINRFW